MEGLRPGEKVFGLGLSKTGTSTLGEALNVLGIKTIHFPSDEDTYRELKAGARRLSVLREYQAVVDIPVVPYYAQLADAYPLSKFILTVRDREEWLNSIEMHWNLLLETWETDSPGKEFQQFICARVYGSLQFNVDRFLHVYDTHVRNVRRHFHDRPEDLLIIDICGGQGWETLCPFLGLPVPPVRFPHLNSWMHPLLQSAQDIAELIPPGDAFILVDDAKFGRRVIPGQRAIPFPERDGHFAGLPPDDRTAIRELERLQRSGARFLVFGWPSFWWFDHYVELGRHVRASFRCILENDRLMIFDLRATSGIR